MPQLLISPRRHPTGEFVPGQRTSLLVQRVTVTAAALCLAFSAIATRAQPTPGAGNPVAGAGAATGVISGRVLNVATGQYLANAQVKIKETNQTANTDKFGGYVIAGVPGGAPSPWKYSTRVWMRLR